MNFPDSVTLSHLDIFISRCILSVCIKVIEAERNYAEIDFNSFSLMLVMRKHWILIN